MVKSTEIDSIRRNRQNTCQLLRVGLADDYAHALFFGRHFEARNPAPVVSLIVSPVEIFGRIWEKMGQKPVPQTRTKLNKDKGRINEATWGKSPFRIFSPLLYRLSYPAIPTQNANLSSRSAGTAQTRLELRQTLPQTLAAMQALPSPSPRHLIRVMTSFL
jgi:hypothetical protein